MGPGAGVYFKQLIVDLTPATCDQEHIPTVLYTNPQIPDRTTAILQGTREDFVSEVCDSLRQLEQFGVAEIFIPCNTSFVGYLEYQAAVDVPIYDLPNRTLDALGDAGLASTILLATTGTYGSQVYRTNDQTIVEIPPKAVRILVHKLIVAVKGGDLSARQHYFPQVIAAIPKDTESVILGCTELSLLSAQFRIARPDIIFIDPLEVAARYICDTYNSVKSVATSHSK